MITNITIKDNLDTPLHYVADVFQDGLSIGFVNGVNIIVGENGCGKTTLLNLLRYYLMVDEMDCSKGIYNSNINRLRRGISDDIPQGVDVYADYERNIFNLTHNKSDDLNMQNMENFSALFEQKHSSTGESIIIAINHLFGYMFGKNAPLKFNYSIIDLEPYQQYVKEHKVECDDSWTIIMDEPDRNLSLDNLKNIEGVLSYKKEHTQIIAVIHNPLLIMSLQRFKHINWIELTDGYLNKLKTIFEKKRL